MFKKLLSNKSLFEFEDISLLLLRLTFGGLMVINHGLKKWDKLVSSDKIEFPDPLGVGAELSLQLTIFGEIVCASLLVIGLLTRLAAIPAIVTMIVAAFVVHGPDSLADKEMAILYLIPYTILLVKGSGKYALDKLIFK